MPSAIELAERALLPDGLIRAGIRRLNRLRLRQETLDTPQAQRKAKLDLVRHMRSSPVAIRTDTANRQHYELPVELFQAALGPHLKYSGCVWPEGVANLGQAEEASLKQVCRRAQIDDGQRILELGCGWGSLSLFMARAYPRARIVSVSNSRLQRAYIERRRRERSLENLHIITADMNDFAPEGTFDRVVSIEMFEHMRNWRELLSRVSTWLAGGGKCFIHIFSHHRLAYIFHGEQEDNWIAQHFFTAGLMPSDDLMLYFQDDLAIEDHWWLGGTGYQKTAEAWLANLDARREEVTEVLAETYGAGDADRWLQRWRIFFMACAELWGCDRGRQWGISHYRLTKKA